MGIIFGDGGQRPLRFGDRAERRRRGLGLPGLAQRIEIHSPLALVIVMLGTNDFQSMHTNNAWHSAQGIAALVAAIRQAPIEPGMPVPPILVVARPPTHNPQGPLAPKFKDAEMKSVGFADALHEVTNTLGCHFFDAIKFLEKNAKS